MSKPYSWRIAQKLQANRRRLAVSEVERTTIYEECDEVIARYLAGKNEDDDEVVDKDDKDEDDKNGDDEDGKDGGGNTVGVAGDEEHSPVGMIGTIGGVLSHADVIRTTARKLWPKRVGVLIKGD